MERDQVDRIDNPVERLELLAGDDKAIATFLDELDVRGPREREMLAELGRTSTVADADGFAVAHRRAVTALESLGRHGYHGSRAGARLGPLRLLVRFLVQLVARFVVVSYLRSVVTSMRNLYWLREIEEAPYSHEFRLLRRARRDAQALEVVFKRRQVGLPTFLLGGVLLPISLSVVNVSSAVAVESWWKAVIAGLVSALIGVGISWVILRGAAMASRRIRLTAQEPLRVLWATVGSCGAPPKDQSRQVAVVAIVLSVAAWIVVPVLVALTFLS